LAGGIEQVAMKTILYTTMAAGLLLCACRKSPEQQIVARVGQVRLTLEDLNFSMPALKDQKMNRLQTERYVQHWLESELIYQQALKEKYNKRPEIQQQIEKLQRDYIVSVYLAQKVDEEIQVTDADMQEYYQQNADEFKSEENLYQIESILVEDQTLAGQVRSRIFAGEEFAALAKKHSLDFSRFQGGAVGFVTLRQLSPLLAAAVARMNANQLSQPIKSELGYNIIRLQAIIPKGQVQPFDEVKDILVQRMRAKKREEAYQALINRLSDKVDMSSDLSVLPLE
jgi:peptidyl-prolyl cis-trans isomerase C